MQRKAQARQKNSGPRRSTQSSTSRRPIAARAHHAAPRAASFKYPSLALLTALRTAPEFTGVRIYQGDQQALDDKLRKSEAGPFAWFDMKAYVTWCDASLGDRYDAGIENLARRSAAVLAKALPKMHVIYGGDVVFGRPVRHAGNRVWIVRQWSDLGESTQDLLISRRARALYDAEGSIADWDWCKAAAEKALAAELAPRD